MGRFEYVNWLAVFVAPLAGFLIGGLWYGPLFSKPWMRLTGMTSEKGKAVSPFIVFGGSYVLNLFAAIGLATLMGEHTGWQFGLHTGLAGGFFYIAMALGVIYLFEQRPVKLWLINAGYQILLFAAMGAIIGAWPR